MHQQLQTRDFDLAIEAVKAVYCPHQLRLGRRSSSLDTRLAVGGADAWPVVRLAYGAEVKVDAGNFDDLFLIMRGCADAATVSQGQARCSWGSGQTVAVSANQATRFEFDPAFSQVSIRLDRQRLEALCARWLGHPLDDDLRFRLQPFAAPMEATWTSVLQFIEGCSAALPLPAAAALEEFVLTTLLRGVPHNFSDELDRPAGMQGSTRLIRRLEDYVRGRLEAAHLEQPELSVSGIAAYLGVSVRSLEIAFQDWRGTTPSAYLRELRLARVRRQLEGAGVGDSVTDIALANGFFHLGRFARYYRDHFRESPSATLLRARRQAARRAN